MSTFIGIIHNNKTLKTAQIVFPWANGSSNSDTLVSWSPALIRRKKPPGHATTCSNLKEIMLSEKRPIPQGDILLYDFIYIAFLSYHNYILWEQISSSQGLGWGKLMGVVIRGHTKESADA